ncbi:hypothetical protein [Albimonas pacifica]|uniref:Glutamine amidotransferase domain-containing protein n=1 Tax=Albimonas pacifica TaxID=1114924 RepID=A0A1I3BT28_9RHOB|nr:hypothetical protein [Albimonas pacifica]SFH65464.1 hypothetical protein SAMN05216258_101326 [Albimonas pacifica]
MNAEIDFAPLLPLEWLAVLAAISAAAVVLSLVLRSPGWALRGLAALALLTALGNPSLTQELRDPLPDVAIVVIDESASNAIDGRDAQTEAAETELAAALDALARDPDAPMEVRTVRVDRRSESVEDADQGTRLLTALEGAAAEIAPDRIAGAILVTDGQAHDPEVFSNFPAPVHVLLTGREGEWDRRLALQTAPAFGIVGEEVDVAFRVEALGDAPEEATRFARVEVRLDGEIHTVVDAPVGRTATLPIPIEHGGSNVVSLSVAMREGELTDRNNAAVFSVNGVRDRLRVLLVSGEPHPGERTWRNLLKADPSVDLVHFTILRPPTKQDGVPVFELSLISFPTRELFMQKIDEFDLIIFDRYRRRGVLPNAYIENVARYVRDGGAILIASGPAFAGVESLYRTPLRSVLPGRPTARIFEQGYRPEVTELGERHPVTAGLVHENAVQAAPSAEDADPGEGPTWGRWFRQIELEATSGQTVMSGASAAPLLILDRVGEGRVASLASDHAWLWSRGFEGGGPQAELLRRLAHWLMKEPELEEEALTAEVAGAEVTVTRRSVETTPGRLTAASPSGETLEAEFVEVGPGRWQATIRAEEPGLWTLTDGVLEGVAAVGPPAPKEFENPVSTGAVLAALADASNGGVMRLADGMPDLRRVRPGRTAAGRGWIGMARQEAYSVRDITLTPLAPGWLMLLLAAGLALGAWRIEGR